ncbi:MAG: tetratricopeptide repeat protein [Acidobacteriota bacterium]|nr:tetratricopeptide repeat protein [Acidobacteriota bacterium]
MELLYNPDRMPEEEIKATFVAREALIDALVELVKGQPDGAGMQHAVIIAPRGMGKTTVMLMVKFAIKDRGLADQWQVVKFPEESYGIYDLADLWIETLELIAADTADTELRQFADSLKIKYPNNGELQEAAYAALKDWRRKHGKRLLLLVENFDQILEQINDERDNARLRDVMMNDDTLMLLGGATTFFKEARAYDQPLYNFFKIYNLHDLRFEQMQELLRRRAERDHISGFEKKLKQNISRLHALEYFTGGSPRLVLMLYRVVTQSDVGEVRRALEKLLDEVTPYYKAKIEILPPQQRKILDHIARSSGQTGEGLTPKEIAEAVRLSPNQVSTQLKRLSELGYVQAANLRGRSSYYTLSEPLYAIWHQMRFGRNARERMHWLVLFLRLWYSIEDMKMESWRLERRFRYHLKTNHTQKAQDILEHHRYLMEAMVDTPLRLQAMERIIHGHLALKDTSTVKTELLPEISLSDLPDGLLDKLVEADCLNQKRATLAKAIKTKLASASSDLEKEYEAIMGVVASAALEEDYAEVLYQLEKLPNIKSENKFYYWALRGGALLGIGRDNEALTCIDQALKLKPDEPTIWTARGQLLTELGLHEEAIASYDRALALSPDEPNAWFLRGTAFYHLNRYEEAIESLDRGLAINPDAERAWIERGVTLVHLHRYEEAVTSFDHVPTLSVDANPDNYLFEVIRSIALINSGRYEEALSSCDKVLNIKPHDASTLCHRGGALFGLGHYQEALENLDQGLKIEADNSEAWRIRGLALDKLGRPEQALASYDRALETKPNDDSAIWFNRGNVLEDMGRYEEAVANYDRALELDPGDGDAWYNRGIALEGMGRYEEAIASYDRALELNLGDGDAWYNRGFACLRWFVKLGKQEKFDLAREKWNEALACGEKSNDEDWPEEVTRALLEVAKSGHLSFARQLIAESKMEERLFPLARAVDYLQTGDEALIEKLSPEVRGIVEEVVAKLKPMA